jgi:hypothetical protein
MTVQSPPVTRPTIAALANAPASILDTFVISGGSL